MVQSFDEFCGHSPIWDEDLLLNSSYPHFTECFQHTLLTWVPCGFLWLLVPFYLRFLVTVDTLPLPLSVLSITKTFLALTMFVLTGVQLIFLGGAEADDGQSYPTAVFVAGSIKAASYLLAAFLVQLERRSGVITSGVLFLFWFLTTLAGIIPFYTLILEKEYDDKLFTFSIFYIGYAVTIVQLVVTSFAEQQQRRGYQELGKPQSPEITASFPSRLSFWWITKLVIEAYKEKIDEDGFWELHPRDQSRRVLPIFQKAWQKELESFRMKEAHKKALEVHERETSFNSDYRHSSERTPLMSTNSKSYDTDRRKTETGKKADKDKDKDKEESKPGPSLLKVLVKVFGGDIIKGWGCKLIYDGLQFVSPLVLNVLIAYVENKENEYEWKGYIYAASFFVVASLQSVFFHQNFHISMTAGMRIKSSLISAVYNKALTMNNEAKKSSTVGEVVNLMSVDCQRVQDITGYLWMLWSAPVQITLAMVLLWQQLGVAVLSGLTLMILMMPLNAVIASKQRKLQISQMRFKDSRIKLMNEVLNGIKVLKLYAWEPSFQKKVQDVRDKELHVLKKFAYLNATTSFFWSSVPFLVILVTFGTYIFIDDTNYLDAQKAFVSISLFNILRFPINLLPMIISFVAQGQVSLSRIGRFLQTGDLDPDNVQQVEIADNAMSIDNGTFTWDRTMEPTLTNVNLEVPDGKLIAVVGQVGSGKSSLVSALLGEMEKLQGRVKVKGSVAYVPQQAWIQNDTLRNNILFGKDVDQNKYKQVIDACALGPDMEILQGGDLTEIGEKGINLSGGQKQRVSLARAVYNNADIYLLDDPLSAVDSHVGKHIFNKVIGSKGLLRNKTRVLVTHGVHWLPMVDNIVVMTDGKISEIGSYEELLSHDGVFAQFLKTYLTQEVEDEEDEDPDVQQMKSKILERVDSVTSGTDGTGVSGDDDVPTKLRSRKKSDKVKPPLLRTISSIDGGAGKGKWTDEKQDKKADKLIEAEKMESGKVSWRVYMQYFVAIGAIWTLLIFIVFICNQGASIGSSIWLAQWTDDPYLKDPANRNASDYQSKNYMYLGIYGLFGLVQAALTLVYAMMTAVRMVRAARILHNGMLANILKLPMEFFDTTPLGRVVNSLSQAVLQGFGRTKMIPGSLTLPLFKVVYRKSLLYDVKGLGKTAPYKFSRDVEVIDNSLPQNFRMFLVTFFGALSVFVVISYSTPLFMIILLPMAVLYYAVQRFYIPTSRQLKRIESTTRSPIYSHFGESISGASTIRGYRLQKQFVQENIDKVDKNLVFYFAGIASNRWLGFRLELLGNLIVLAAAIFAVVTPGNTGGLVGLSISYALQVTGALNFLVRNTSDVETNVVSIERIKEYTEASTEADWIVPFHRPAKDWPQYGNVRFNDYSTRYRQGLDLVLRGISVDIQGGERVGIVGRTGAGKSSLTVALFRLIESAGGSIVIDNERISDLGLHDLRSKLTILPQDPVLFSGSLRMNLDPFDDFPDDKIWQSLEHAHLKNFVSGLPDKLEHECGEGGQNLSVGQRQLVCLARTLLRKTKILVLDEATAAVDMETDDLIQKTIREEFRGCTILTIAHRLNTIMDYDKIVVLDQGLIKEFDHPNNLLKDPNTIFYGMAKDANLV